MTLMMWTHNRLDFRACNRHLRQLGLMENEDSLDHIFQPLVALSHCLKIRYLWLNAPFPFASQSCPRDTGLCDRYRGDQGTDRTLKKATPKEKFLF